MKTVKLNISGMACAGCADAVESVLKAIDGIQSAQVNLEQGTAEVACEITPVPTESFEKAIENAGYTFAGVIA